MQEESSYLHIQSSSFEAVLLPWTLRPPSQAPSLHLSDYITGRHLADTSLLKSVHRTCIQVTHCLPRPFPAGFLSLKVVFGISLLQIVVSCLARRLLLLLQFKCATSKEVLPLDCGDFVLVSWGLFFVGWFFFLFFFFFFKMELHRVKFSYIKPVTAHGTT